MNHSSGMQDMYVRTQLVSLLHVEVCHVDGFTYRSTKEP